MNRISLNMYSIICYFIVIFKIFLYNSIKKKLIMLFKIMNKRVKCI